MNTNLINRFTGGAAALVLLLPIAAGAQQMGGPGGFGQAPPPMFNGQGPDQGQRQPRPDEFTLANISVSTLTTALKLSDDQRVKIAAIQAKFESVRKALMPPPNQMSNRQRPGAGQGGGPGQGGSQGFDFGGPPRPNGMGRPPMDGGGADFPPPPVMIDSPGQGRPGGREEEVQDMNADASDKIVEILSSQQQAQLTKLTHTLRDLRLVGISPDSYSNLNLSDSQLSKIAGLAAAHRADILKTVATDQRPWEVQASLMNLRRKLHTDTIAILTDDQAAIVRSQQPNRPGGGPDGFQPEGGPRGYGQDGQRPRPDNGPGMPPADGQMNGGPNWQGAPGGQNPQSGPGWPGGPGGQDSQTVPPPPAQQ